MEKKIDDGGPAFPTKRYNLSDDGSEQIDEHRWRVPGMTLRQWYAGLAMQGLIAKNVNPQSMGVWDSIAKALEFADKLIKAEKESRS